MEPSHVGTFHPNDPLSPSLDPAALDDLAPPFIDGQDAAGPVYGVDYTFTKAKFASAAARAEKMLEAHRALAAASGGRIDPREMERLRSGIARGYAAACKDLDDAEASLTDDHLPRLDAAIADAVGIETARTSVTDAMRAGQVADYLRSLPDLKRMSVIQDAIREGDREFIAGALAMPRLAGLSIKEAAQLMDDAARTWAGPAFARREAIGKMILRIRAARAALHARFGDLAGAGDSAQARYERAMAGLAGEGGAA